MRSVIHLEAGCKTAPHGPVFADLSLTVDPGESVALVGRSGSGKSTLLACLGLLDGLSSGTYLLRGKSVRELGERGRCAERGRIGFVFQNFSLIPYLTARANVMAPFVGARPFARRQQRSRAADAMLDELGIGHLARRRPDELSGGEQQRVSIARALVRRPSIVLADEPAGSLDAATGRHVMDTLLTAARDRGVALLTVTHDEQVAARHDRVIVMPAMAVVT